MPRAKPQKASFRKELTTALEQAIARLRTEIGSERLYAFALYTSGEDAFSYVCASGNTEEGLTRAAARYAETNLEYAGEAGRSLLRWSAPDWAWHDFSPEVRALQLPEGDSDAHDRRIYADFTAALKALDEAGAFGAGDARPTLAILCGDIGEPFRQRSLKALNPSVVFEKYRAEHTAEPYLDELGRLPAARRLAVVISLYRELALDLDTPRAADARRRKVSQYVIKPVIAALGLAASAPLLDLVEAHGFAAAFHETGTDGWKKHGAFTAEHKLAMSSILLVQETGMTDADVARVQALIAQRLQIDRDAADPVSPLAGCMARVLHAVRPDRFPPAMENAKNNRLDNPDGFVARPRRWWQFW